MPLGNQGAGESRRSFNMMVRLRPEERERIAKCFVRYNRQRSLDGLRVLVSQSDFVRHAVAELCNVVEHGIEEPMA